MKKRDYFLEAIRGKAYKRNAWVLRCFSKSNVPMLLDESNPPSLRREPTYDWELMLGLEGQLGFFNPESGEWTNIDDVPKDRALFHKREGVTIAPKELENVSKEIHTTYGNVLYNAIALIDALGSRFEFVTGKIDPVAVERSIASLVKDDPAEGEEVDGEIYVRDLIKHCDNVINLGGYNQLFVPSATPYTMTAAPKAKARLKELLEEHKDDLNNPVTIAKIWKEVAVLDREYLESDPDKGFVIKGKTVDVVRKRLFYMFGIEADFGGNGEHTFIAKPLDEGLDLSKADIMNNSVREGSINRGVLTAQGGEKFKRIIQATSGVLVEAEDCGSKASIEIHLTKKNVDRFNNCYLFDGEKEVLLSQENQKQYLGKVVNFRSPEFCNITDGNYCIHCVGEFIRGRPKALPMLDSDVGSIMMAINMAMMHGKELKTVRVKLQEVMS